jgi:hypothetical protein
MLDCRDHKKQAQAARNRERNRRHRERLRRGQLCVIVQIDGAILDYLQRTRWLNAHDAHDVSKIAQAIKACLELSAKV